MKHPLLLSVISREFRQLRDFENIVEAPLEIRKIPIDYIRITATSL
jgi:hypothetical protein